MEYLLRLILNNSLSPMLRARKGNEMRKDLKTLADFMRLKDTDEMTFDEYKQIRDDLKVWLLSQKIHSHGNYDWQDWETLKCRKANLVRKLRDRGLNTCHNYGIFERLNILPNGGFDYIVGQSWPEECITLLECLTFSGRRK